MNRSTDADGTLYVAISAGQVRVAPRPTDAELVLIKGMQAANRTRVRPPSLKIGRSRRIAAFAAAAACATVVQVIRLTIDGIMSVQQHARGA